MENLADDSQVPLEEISNWTFKFQKVWGGGQQRWDSFGFQLIPDEDSDPNVPKSHLYKAIRHGGGVIYSGNQDSDNDNPLPNVIRVLNEEYFLDNEDEDCVIPLDTYSSAFIYACIRNKKKNIPYPDSWKYIISRSTSRYGIYNALKILRQELNWENLDLRVFPPKDKLTARQWMTKSQSQKVKLHQQRRYENLKQEQSTRTQDKVKSKQEQQQSQSNTNSNEVEAETSTKRKDLSMMPILCLKRVKIDKKVTATRLNSGLDEENHANNDKKESVVNNQGGETEPSSSDFTTNKDPLRRFLAILQPQLETKRYCMRPRSTKNVVAPPPTNRRLRTRSAVNYVKCNDDTSSSSESDVEDCQSSSSNSASSTSTSSNKSTIMSTSTTSTTSSSRSEQRTLKLVNSSSSSFLNFDSDSDQDTTKSTVSSDNLVVESPKICFNFFSQPYTDKEGQLILDVVCEQNAFTYVHGIKFWKILEASKLIKGRTCESLKTHFLKQVVPKVKNNETYKISKYDLQRLNNALSNPNRKRNNVCPDLAL